MNIYILITSIMCFFILTTHSHYGMILIRKNGAAATVQCSKSKSRYQQIAVVFLGMLLTLITGLRSSKISEDYQHYEFIFKNEIKNIPWIEIGTNREPLFKLLMKVIGELTDYNIVVLMVVISVITVFFLFRYIYKEATYPVFIIFMLFTIGSYYTSFNTTRQYLAIALYTIAFKYACERNAKGYIISVAVISLVHFSAIITLPFYWLLNLSWKKPENNIIVMAFWTVFFFRVKEIINWLIGIYYYNIDESTGSLYESAINPLNIIRPLVILGIALLFRKKLNLRRAEDNCLFNSSLYFLVFYLYAYQVTLFMRFTYFFIPGSLILVDRLLDRMNALNRKIIFGMLIAFCIAWCAMGMFRNEYLFFWQ